VPPPTKQQLALQLQTIVKLHRRGSGGLAVALALTRRIDHLIEAVFQSLPDRNKRLVAAVATGGYGRKELCFSSDVDIMFLIRDEHDKAAASPVIGDLLHHLLDYGLDIGHSFRTIDECLETRREDSEIWNSLLECRFICGSMSTYAAFRSRFQRHIKSFDAATFAQHLVETTAARHGKYGLSTKLLEPNIKNSAGGLRDLHTVMWLVRGTGLAPLPTSLRPTDTALTALLRSPVMRRFFTRTYLNETTHGLDFLLRVRNEMHLEARSLHDTMEFNSQRKVSHALKYKDLSRRTSVERFMKDYYIAARSVSQLAQRILSWADERYRGSAPRSKSVRRLTPPFVVKNGQLDIGRNAVKLPSEESLRAFVLSLEQRVPFSNHLEDVLTRSASAHRPLRHTGETALLRTLLNKPHGVSQAIRRMNELGLLARWLPEWKGLVAFFQHNQYHFYTADEHTLIVLANAEALSTQPSRLGEIFRSLPRRDTLYLASLCHDIAKPIRIGDHEIIGVDVARAILTRLRYTDVLDDVTFLVRHHLLMEQVAFRRNLADPQTILDFTKQIATAHRLDLLYLLTYADLSAVNKNVWTDWKATLLEELYRRSWEVLSQQLTQEEFVRAEADRQQTVVQGLVTELKSTVPEEQARDHLDAVESPIYLATFDAAEIAEHIRRIETAETVSTVFKQKDDHTEVTVIARDAPFALSRFCGVLSANDANILDAQIFTRNDGVIIDRFRVVDFVTKASLGPARCGKIHQDLNFVFEETADIEQLLDRHRMRWKRRSTTANPNVRIDVEFEDHPRFTIIDVYAPDMLGFLYRITGTISFLGMNISFAKIATRIDGIVDSFYVLDFNGKKLDGEQQRTYVRNEILHVIYDLTESELVMQ
jgi:[protein-PII] uridylyltransferase